MKNHYWRLPEGVDEVLPPDALQLETLRRELIDLFVSWGYNYVIPPMLEYLDALLVGAGHDLDLQTIKFVDQLSGRMLGLRADMTSQAARIDAHSLSNQDVQRLCYAGTVLHANPQSLSANRNPMIAGAELFGSASIEADAEIVCLMARALREVGVADLVVELGDISIYRALVDQLELDTELDELLFRAIQMKSSSDIDQLLGDVSGDLQIKDCLQKLPDMMGADEVFEATCLRDLTLPAVQQSLDSLEKLAALIRKRDPEIGLRFDLGELSGYGYHTGLVFTAYAASHGRELAKGGRYDGIGRAFGETRSATGFDLDLKALPKRVAQDKNGLIWVSWNAAKTEQNHADLIKCVEQLRQKKQIVVFALDAQQAPLFVCDRQLVFDAKDWIVKPIENLN